MPLLLQAYDYSVAAEYHAAARQDEAKIKRVETEHKLDEDLGDYWKKGPQDEEEIDDAMETGVRRKEDAICAGKKRNIKERLGAKKSNNPQKHKGSHRNRDGQMQEGASIEDLSIPQPGVPRTIPDLSSDFVESLLGKDISYRKTEYDPGSQLKSQMDDMDEENSNSRQSGDLESQNNAELLGEELAARLCEPKTE